MRAITPTAGGGVRVELPTAERDLLGSLPAELRAVLRGEVDVAGARDRLFPRAYDDDELDAEYRELTGAGLEEERLAAVDAFAETLEAGTSHRQRWWVELDADAAEAWLSATNDARLVLAAALGIEREEDWELAGGRGAPDPSLVALRYLSWLQEALIDALSGVAEEE